MISFCFKNEFFVFYLLYPWGNVILKANHIFIRSLPDHFWSIIWTNYNKCEWAMAITFIGCTNLYLHNFEDGNGITTQPFEFDKVGCTLSQSVQWIRRTYEIRDSLNRDENYPPILKTNNQYNFLLDHLQSFAEILQFTLLLSSTPSKGHIESYVFSV